MAADERGLGRLRDLARAHASDAARPMIADARREARERVYAQLVDVFADALLAEVADALAPTPAVGVTPEPSTGGPSHADGAPVRPAPPAARSEEELGWYVYCVVDANSGVPVQPPAGIDPAYPVSALAAGRVAAVVSRVALEQFGEEPLRERLADMGWLEQTARAHERVLEAVAGSTTLIPMRLCSVYREAAGVRAMLEREAAALEDALQQLDGKAEWGVKAFADPEAVAGEEPGEESAADEAEGTAYMHRQLEKRRQRSVGRQRLDEACAALHTALCAVAEEGRTSAVQRPEVSGRDLPMILNASYLVRDDSAGEFHDQVTRTGRELAALGVSLETTGPWPPYNFVPGTIGAAW